jgi:hypothetical protein
MHLYKWRYHAMSRSATEVKARCHHILGDKRIVSLVVSGCSPSAVYEMIFNETKDVSKSKAGRWLAVLKRDYPEEFSELIQSTDNHAKDGTVN